GGRRRRLLRQPDAVAGGAGAAMTDRDWFLHFEAEARVRRDPERLRLVALVYEADQHRETDPDRMLGLIDEGRRLARRLAEPWWARFYDDRRAGALTKYKG